MKSLDQQIELLVPLTYTGRVLEPLGTFSNQFLLGLFNLCPELGLVLVIDEAQGGEFDMFVGWVDAVSAEGLRPDLNQPEIGFDEVVKAVFDLEEARV